jgi:glycosyltransferase involved in cell wall biosynthesis
MAAGLPIVASNVGGIPDLVDEDSASLVPPRDPSALAAAIMTVLRTPSLLGSMSIAAKKRALGFSRDSYDHALTNIYQQTLAEFK